MMERKFAKFQSPRKGKGLRATARLAPGELLYTAEPFAYVVAEVCQHLVCGHCLRTIDHLLRCSQCKIAKYCSKRCQTEAWPDHKRECKCLKNAGDEQPPGTVRLVGRTIFKILRKSPCPSEELYSMPELKPTMEALSVPMKARFLSQTMMLQRYLKPEIPDLSAFSADFNATDLFPKSYSNNFRIYNGRLQVVGTGLYPSMSLLNHSCDPNCMVFFDGQRLLLRAEREIQVGEELTIRYVKLLMPTWERQKKLREIFGFECNCHQCLTLGMEDDMLAGEKQASDQTRDALPIVLKLRTDYKFEQCLDVCKTLLRRNVGRLPDRNIYQLQVLDTAMKTSLNLKQFEEALMYGCRTLGPYRLYYSALSPSRAVQLMNVGSLQYHVGEQREGLETMTEALSTMTLSHGKDHSLTHELVLLIETCKAGHQTMIHEAPPQAKGRKGRGGHPQLR